RQWGISQDCHPQEPYRPSRRPRSIHFALDRRLLLRSLRQPRRVRRPARRKIRVCLTSEFLRSGPPQPIRNSAEPKTESPPRLLAALVSPLFPPAGISSGP